MEAIKHLVISGSREILDYTIFTQAMRILSKGLQMSGRTFTTLEVVEHGDARGVDQLATLWHSVGRKKGIFDAELKMTKPNWKPNGGDAVDRSAGHRRNHDMASRADVVLCVWDGESKGTRGMMDWCLKKGIECYAYIKVPINEKGAYHWKWYRIDEPEGGRTDEDVDSSR